MNDYADIPDEPCGLVPTEPARLGLDELCRKAVMPTTRCAVVLWTPALGARVVEVRDLEDEK